MRGTEWRTNGSLVALAAALALALAFGPAQATTFTAPGDSATIQGAVDMAGDGDTVLVKKCTPFLTGVCGPNGEWNEKMEIVGKSITLKCAGAVLDGAPQDGVQIEDEGIFIDGAGAAGTKVIGCTVQFFGKEGIKVDDVDDVTIQNCTLIGNKSQGGLNLKGNNFLIKGNTAIDNGGDGIDIRGDSSDGLIVRNVTHSNGSAGIDMDQSDNKRNTFLNNRAFRNGNEGFRLKGEEHTVRRNRAETNGLEGFQLGNGFNKGLVEKNLSRGNDSDGFECDGNCDENTFLRNVALNNGDDGFRCPNSCDDNKFIKNLAGGNETEGFDISGDDHEFTGNRAIENQEGGFKIDCDNNDVGPTCGGPIVGNRSIRNLDDHGFNMRDLLDTTVYHNKAIGNEDHGFICDTCDKVMFTENTAKDNGEDGFNQTGSADNTYEKNKSVKNNNDGFHIDGTPSDTKLINNTANKNGADGIDIDDDASDTDIEGNTVKDNAGTGIENNGGPDTIISGNTVKGNRTDIAGAGDGGGAGNATLDGTNSFSTGGFDVKTECTGPGDGPSCP